MIRRLGGLCEAAVPEGAAWEIVIPACCHRNGLQPAVWNGTGEFCLKGNIPPSGTRICFVPNFEAGAVILR